jgi:hypothetical protein
MKINEKLGIPEDILEQSDVVYNLILKKVEMVNQEKLESLPYKDGDDIEINIGHPNIKIADINKKMFISIEIKYIEDLKGLKIAGASIGSETEIKKNNLDILKFEIKNETPFILTIKLIGNTITKYELVNTIKNKLKREIIAHELKHLYDNYKNPVEGIKTKIDYGIFKRINKNIPKPILNIFYAFYYVSKTENLVRPVEIYKKMKDNNINKETFKPFLKGEKTIEILTKYSQYTIEDLKSELNNIDLDSFLNSINNFKRTGDDKKDVFDICLNFIVGNMAELISYMVNNYYNKVYLKDNKLSLFDLILDPFKLEMREKIFDKNIKHVLNRYMKYEKDPEQFFEKLLEKIRHSSKKTLRKIYKLYDLLKDTPNTKISNWDMHNKINLKSESNIFKFDEYFHNL